MSARDRRCLLICVMVDLNVWNSCHNKFNVEQQTSSKPAMNRRESVKKQVASHACEKFEAHMFKKKKYCLSLSHPLSLLVQSQ
jgi:hypothetical protein